MRAFYKKGLNFASEDGNYVGLNGYIIGDGFHPDQRTTTPSTTRARLNMQGLSTNSSATASSSSSAHHPLNASYAEYERNEFSPSGGSVEDAFRFRVHQTTSGGFLEQNVTMRLAQTTAPASGSMASSREVWLRVGLRQRHGKTSRSNDDKGSWGA